MINLNDPNVLMQIMQETKQKWRNCKRKQYNIFACKMPKDIVFANKLEQPDSFNAMKKVLGKYISTVDECRQHPDLMQILAKGGFYQTDGNCITLCGTAGELWTIKEEKLKSAYTNINGAAITKIPRGWFTVARAAEATAQAVGIYIPKKYIGVYQTGWGAVLYVNNPNSDGHNMGDILVAPMINGQPNLADCSPTNNTVFTRTYDLNVGGWGSLGIKADSSKPFTLEDCKRLYPLPKAVDIMHSFQPVLDHLASNEVNLLPKMQCGYYDLDELDTVWFEPVNGVNVGYLYKDFYMGVVKADDGLYVTFRNVVGDGCDLDVKVEPTINAVRLCIYDVISDVKLGYWTYTKALQYIGTTYGDKSRQTTYERMDDGVCIHDDGLQEGRYIGLKDDILNHMGATDKEIDAYLACQLVFDEQITKSDRFSRHVDVWIQGEAADNTSEKLGKNLQCRASSLSDLQKQVDAMMGAIKSL